MTAPLIDGLAAAKRIRQDIALRTEQLRAAHGVVPGLAVILVGDDPASQVYVRNKNRVCEEVGFQSISHMLPADTTQEDLMVLIDRLNKNADVNGILVQLPLPKHMNERAVLNAIDPAKDVDGFHPMNAGKLSIGLAGLAPCTPKGAMILLHETCPDLRGKRALVVGRSNIVGKPMALMLLQANCTVTMAHSQTHNLAEECGKADILVAALGKPHFIKGSWIKEGAIVIDVGINRVDDPETGKHKLAGDVEFPVAITRAAAITPVPGGVGPMTIACLMLNTYEATLAQHGWTPEI